MNKKTIYNIGCNITITIWLLGAFEIAITSKFYYLGSLLLMWLGFLVGVFAVCGYEKEKR
ncbi:hypothetical protein PANI_CDS0029 [Maribacter phage Panino]